MTAALRLPDVVPTAASLLDWVPLDWEPRCVCGGVWHVTLDPDARLIEQCDQCWRVVPVPPRRNAPLDAEPHLSLVGLRGVHKASLRDMSQQRVMHTCAECGLSFPTRAGNRRVCCSATCVAARRARWYLRRQQESQVRLCGCGCGTPLTGDPRRKFLNQEHCGRHKSTMWAIRRTHPETP